MAKLDKKEKTPEKDDKRSLTSFEKKRGEKIVFAAKNREKKIYRVANVRKIDVNNSLTIMGNSGEKSVSDSENTKPINNKNMGAAQAYKKAKNKTYGTAKKPENTVREPEKAITPEMVERMKRAAFLAQKNDEAIKLSRATVVDAEEKQEYYPALKAEFSEDAENVPVEHLEEEKDEIPRNSYLGNSEHAVFDTYDSTVRAYREKKAYANYIGKQKNNSRKNSIEQITGTVQTVGELSRGDFGKVIGNAAIGSIAGEGLQNAFDGAETVGNAVSNSDSVGSTVLDVSSVLAEVEAKKMVKKIAETDIKRKKRVDERVENHGNRYGIEKYDEVTGKNEKPKKSKNDVPANAETSGKKQGSSKVGSSHKMQQEKQEYGKKQRAKEIKGKQKEIFIKENKKISDTLFSGKSGVFKRFFAKKGSAAIIGGGAVTVAFPIFLVIIIFILISAFFGWLSPFSYSLAGEDDEHEAETKAEIIDGNVLMVKNYMDVTQAYYYLNYGDWYGGTYQYGSAELDFGAFFSDYCQDIVDEIREYYQPLIAQAQSPEQAAAISQAMGQAISRALANSQAAAMQEYSQLLTSLDDEFTPSEHRQHYEVEVTSGGNGTDDSADFDGKPIVGTNNFGNLEINSELSSEELLSYIALYKSLKTLAPDSDVTEINITPQDIMNFIEETEFISITAEISHNNSCPGQNCKRRLVETDDGYYWEYYCDGDHDNLSGEIGDCLTADELLAKVMELTDAEDLGVSEEDCQEIVESYLDMFKKELNIDESEFRQFGAADNAKANEFYQTLITDELPNGDLWEVNTPFQDAE